jgi:hypothetical protein
MALPSFNPTVPRATVETSPATALMTLLEAPEYSREALQRNDLSKLSEAQRDATIRYLCEKYGLPQDEGLITVIKSNGQIKPYVTAPGVFKLARDKVKSLSVNIVTDGVPTGYVVVRATAISNEGREFQAYGSKRAIVDYDVALMKADTAARVRACKVAVNLSLMTYAEASSMDETIDQEKESEAT